MTRKAGRPRGAPDGDCVEINQVALLLQRLLDDAGITTKDLYARLAAEHFELGRVPSFAVVARRLRGRGLQREPFLVDFVVELCAPAEALDRTRRTVNRLLEDAAPGRGTPVRAAVGQAGLFAEVEGLRLELHRTMDELRQLTERLIAAPTASSHGRAADARPRHRASARDRPPVEPDPVAVPAIRWKPPAVDAAAESAATALPDVDVDVDTLASALRELDPSGSRFAEVLRRCLDMLYDGARTGRYRWEQLTKHEKTFLGSLVRQETAREFGLVEGEKLEFRLRDVEFNIGFSTTVGRWLVPKHAVGAVYLLLAGNEDGGAVSASVVRASRDRLGMPSQDLKRVFAPAGRAAMRWLYRQTPLPVNLLATLPAEDLEAIFSPRSGAQRVSELFRRVLQQPIDSTAVRTVAMQVDATKRARDAQYILRSEGILVLSGQGESSRIVLERLGLARQPGAWWMSVPVTPFADHDTEERRIFADGVQWVVARPGDPVVEAPSVHRMR